MAVRKNPDQTPAMRQFHHFKKQYPDCVIFFRMGDFYEMFHDDAKLANRVLGVTLTQRSKGIPMAGVPYHAVENYLRRMIQAGYRVAVCDQVEDPKQATGVVKRDVTRLVTPGTLTDETLLEAGRTSPLAALAIGQDRAQVAWAELSTGAFAVADFELDEVADELARVAPSELLYAETSDGERPRLVQSLTQSLSCAFTGRPAWQFRRGDALKTLCKQYHVATLAGFGLDDDEPVLGPASAIIHYLLETQCTAQADESRIAHLRPPRRFGRSDHLGIDQTSLRSLEIERTLRNDSTAGSLLGVLSHCRTAMGKRLLRQWLCYPLCNRQEIEQRQRIVGAMIEDERFLDGLCALLDEIQDVQRIVGRIAVGRATPRDLVVLGQNCAKGLTLRDLLADRPAVASFHHQLDAVVETLAGLGTTLTEACVQSPPAHLREGGLIRDGHDGLLDEQRDLQRDSNAWLAGYQKQLIDETGVASLKIAYNKVFGYYIELTTANRQKAPHNWSRKQTLKNAERYSTAPLKAYEGKVLTARQRAIEREQELFAGLCTTAQNHLESLHALADAVAQLDVLACFAHQALKHHYVRPVIVDQPALHIKGGRHPVLDELLGNHFVPNDVDLGPRSSASDNGSRTPTNTLALITGPNMSGKSTYIRQTALITLLAHTGCFVPAVAATIGLCDRIFTRIGASDELHAGQSTFMVEMTETANICHHATARSLIVLDEIGRGTSTLDGLALAWAIAEFLAQKHPRTLFATHYHELTALSQQYDNVINLNVTVREWHDEIVFLHRIVPGATDRSYGIHVAKIAGLPERVVERAKELLGQLAVSHEATSALDPQPAQLPLFTEYVQHPALEQLSQTDLNNLTPIQAFDLLRRLRQEMDG